MVSTHYRQTYCTQIWRSEVMMENENDFGGEPGRVGIGFFALPPRKLTSAVVE